MSLIHRRHHDRVPCYFSTSFTLHIDIPCQIDREASKDLRDKGYLLRRILNIDHRLQQVRRILPQWCIRQYLLYYKPQLCRSRGALILGLLSKIALYDFLR
jgi:hypothetical protein